MPRVVGSRPGHPGARAAESRLVPVALLLAALLLGCSSYPDPYTGICPSLEDVRVTDLTATSARVRFESDHLMQAYLRVSPSNGPERVVRGSGRALQHDVLLEDLQPDTPYRVVLVKDLRGQGDFEDLVVPCGADETLGFRTRSLEAPTTTGTPVPDPPAPVAPFTAP